MKAMILSAGYGTRLGSLTREIPKPMLRLQGRPMLEYIVCNLRAHGFDHLVINLHFRPETIRQYFGDGSRWGVKLEYSYENDLLGTAGGVKNVEGFFRDESVFLVHYGDVLTDQNLRELLEFHQARQALVTLLVHQRQRSNSIVSLDPDGRIVGFLERPDEIERSQVRSPWVNSGVSLCAPEVLEVIPSAQACDLPRDIFPKLVDTGRLFGCALTGYRCAVDSPERLAEARAAVAEGRCRIDLDT